MLAVYNDEKKTHNELFGCFVLLATHICLEFKMKRLISDSGQDMQHTRKIMFLEMRMQIEKYILNLEIDITKYSSDSLEMFQQNNGSPTYSWHPQTKIMVNITMEPCGFQPQQNTCALAFIASVKSWKLWRFHVRSWFWIRATIDLIYGIVFCFTTHHGSLILGHIGKTLGLPFSRWFDGLEKVTLSQQPTGGVHTRCTMYTQVGIGMFSKFVNICPCRFSYIPGTIPDFVQQPL